MTSTSATRRGTALADQVDQRGQARGVSAPSRRGRPPARRPRRATPGTFSKPGTRRLLALVLGQRRAPPGVLADDQHAHARRAAPLVRARRQQRPAAGDGHPPGRLRGVDEQRHPGRPARLGDLGDRLERADLVVGGLQAGQRGVRAQRRGELLRVDPAGAVDARPSVTLPPSRSCSPAACSTLECSTALTTRCRPARRRACRVPSTPRWTAWVPEEVKDDLVGPRAENGRDLRTGLVEQHAGAAAPSRTAAAGSAQPAVQRAQQRLARRRVQGFGGGRVEVGAGTTLTGHVDDSNGGTHRGVRDPPLIFPPHV